MEGRNSLKWETEEKMETIRYVNNLEENHSERKWFEVGNIRQGTSSE